MGPSNSAPRVFIVDDEHVIASTLAAILRIHGYSATVFTSPVEALAAARTQGHDFDLPLKPVPPIDLLFEVGKVVDGLFA
jgi:CheY-like chemotaxis protein